MGSFLTQFSSKKFVGIQGATVVLAWMFAELLAAKMLTEFGAICFAVTIAVMQIVLVVIQGIGDAKKTTEEKPEKTPTIS
jgi:hypothetical protein